MRNIFSASVALAICMMATQAIAGHMTVWVIDGETEKPYFQQLGDTFNVKFKDKGITVDVTPIPSINDATKAASQSGGLPDVIMIDGPNMASMAWAGTLQPITNLLDAGIADDLLPAVKAQGTYTPTGDMYAISPYDSSVVLWGNKAYLEKAGVRIPKSPDDAWTREEMRDALDKLSKVPGVKWPLDVKMNYGAGEWMTYGFSPLVQSNGGDLIDRTTFKAEGTINSAANVDALNELQDWVKKGWIAPASAGDNTFYGDKTSALSWVGNWMWPAHKKGLGADLVLIPAPKFGPAGPKSGNGGWSWAVPASSKNLDDIKAFLNYAMSTEQVAQYANITGYAPSRKSSIPLTPDFKEGGAGALFAEQGACCAVVRPVYPGYPVITSAWSQAMVNILTGTADVKSELDKAAKAIDQDIADNDGYPPFGTK